MNTRPSVIALRHLSFITIGTGLALLLLPQTVAAQESATDVQVPDTADAVVRVRGMACSACAQRMKSALNDVEGVHQASVLLDKQEVVLTLSEEQIPSEKTLRETVRNAGYEFRSVVFAKGQTIDGSDD